MLILNSAMDVVLIFTVPKIIFFRNIKGGKDKNILKINK